jgi:molybdenum cofactor synthesis domain-containing protein
MSAADLDRLLQPDEALQIVLSRVRPLPVETVSLEQAGNRVLAEPVVSDSDLPPFRASTMDGYAVVHDDPAPERLIVGQGFAGDDTDIELTFGTAFRIMTGAPVPVGASAVVRVENTETRGDHVRILQPAVREAENIRPIGSDMRRGDEVLPVGSVIGPAEIGILASLGQTSVPVRRRPRVVVLSTGDELVQPSEIPASGQIRDSNRFSLGLAAERAGADVILNRHVPDSLEELRTVIWQAINEADVLITSGGVSMGDRDLVKALLGEVAEVHFRRVFMKPGKPLNFATAGDKLLFGLPGNPVSCLVSFHVFVRPALQLLQGVTATDLPRVPVRLETDVEQSDRIEYQRAEVSTDAAGAFVARITGPQQSARLMSFVGANALVVVPPGEGGVVEAGETLDALLLDLPKRRR